MKTVFIPEIHHNFSINGKKELDLQDLRQIASSYIKKGEVPKTIKIRKAHMINSAKATGTFFEIEEKTTALLCLSANYIAGKMMLVRAMVLGWKLDTVPPSINPLDVLETHYDFCAMVPLQLRNSINRLHLITKLIVGGGTVSKNLMNLVQEAHTQIYETYGMTETVSHIAVKQLNHLSAKANIFKILPEIKITQDKRNCLVIDAPKLSSETIVTNDVVKLHSPESFEWLGRYDNVINSGGIKLFPEQIEEKLKSKIDKRFFIASQEDNTLGQALILFVEGEKETLDTSVFDELDAFEKPKQVYYISQFSETSSGKIQRKKTLKFLKN